MILQRTRSGNEELAGLEKLTSANKKSKSTNENCKTLKGSGKQSSWVTGHVEVLVIVRKEVGLVDLEAFFDDAAPGESSIPSAPWRQRHRQG